MAKVGAGCEEFFDPKTKSKWERKVNAYQKYICAHVYTYAHTINPGC